LGCREGQRPGRREKAQFSKRERIRPGKACEKSDPSSFREREKNMGIGGYKKGGSKGGQEAY